MVKPLVKNCYSFLKIINWNLKATVIRAIVWQYTLKPDRLILRLLKASVTN